GQPGARPAPRPQPRPQAAPAAQPPAAPSKPSMTPLKVTTQATVRELAEKMNVPVPQFIKKLMQMGVFATINQRLEPDTAVVLAHDFGFDLQVQAMHMEAELAAATESQDKPENLKPRPPVVTIMGHVDHGKTSLLDAIRQANVAGGEAGGITQHIGAYRVTIPKGDIVFLDTPGHEAFTAMRARGAKATDIVVLVVSAADGLMPQTVEAIDHAKAAGVPIVVAVNKIDLPTANAQKIRQELSSHGLVSEEWGGKHIFVDVSAKKRVNLEKLLEMLLLQAEVMELKANPDRPGVGVVLEARLDARRGAVATVLVQTGTVKVGDSFVAGLSYGKVKAMVTDRGDRLLKAGPSTPIELLGISGEVPQAGDVFNIVAGDRQAKEIAEKRRLMHREESLAHKKHMSLVSLRAQAGGAGMKTLQIVLKADAQGSVQAIKDSLEKLSNNEIQVRVIHAGTGNLNESDVLLANASDAVVMLFHVGSETRADELTTRNEIEVRRYEIIYDLVADVKAAMEGLLEPEVVDVVVGKAEVREIFNARGSKVAGSMVLDGKVTRGSTILVFRGAQKLAEAKIASLKRFKDDVKEVEKGLDCGILLEGYQDFQKGDRFDVIVKEKRTRRLEPAK
ncbi:MAG: translation initiation factor IF-2, partial [Elusimicrobia bacterium]|nr:translation initiation factor IF-2 [Elusimicrobiota bacterium]